LKQCYKTSLNFQNNVEEPGGNVEGNNDPQAAIYVEEEHFYDVDLGVVPFITWQKAIGSLRIEIPYDGAVLDQEMAQADDYPIGNVQISRPDNDRSELIPVSLQAGDVWEKQIKSNKKCLIKTRYEIDEPSDSLVSIDGVVLDDVLDGDSQLTAEGILGKVDVFSNPLALQFSLWVPDLLAETRPSELYELETMLLRGESTRRLFISHINSPSFEQHLTEGLAALANSAGGTLLIGADKSGYVAGIEPDLDTKRYLYTALMKAALRSDPPVPIWQLSEIQQPSGKLVVRIEVPVSNMAVHRLDGVLFKRQGKNNTPEEQASNRAVNLPAPPPLPESDLVDIFNRDEAGTISFRNQDDVVVLNGSNGIKNLGLGAYLCGLINAEKRTGRIIITDLPIDTPRRTRILRNSEDINKILSGEMAKLLPHFPTPTVEPRHLGNQKIYIIHLPPWQYPISLYDGQGYQWQNPALNQINIEGLFERYSKLAGSRGQAFDNQDAYLELALLNRPIRPPEEMEKKTSLEIKEGLFYDVEYQAQVWQPRPFKRDEDTVGYSLQIAAPLRHVSLTFTDEDKVGTKSPEANGRIRIRLNDVLVSDLKVTPQANEDNPWFNAIPIIKRTYLDITYKARLNELFKRRTKTSRLRFLIPDVLLDRERVDDLAHVCADIGFRVFDTSLLDTAPSAPAKATIRGIRSFGYYDISLLIGLLCHQSELTRELHYDGWHDSKPTTTSILDLRVKLWGTGKNVELEIGRLQMQLYKTISRRLQHLRAE
jgi:hypothetical protein